MGKKKTNIATCLICGKELQPGSRRGLCEADYQKFRRARAKVRDDEIDEWEGNLIADGLLLPDARAAIDPFTEAIAKLRRERRLKLGSEVPAGPDDEAKIAEDLEQESKREQAKSASKTASQSKQKKKSG